MPVNKSGLGLQDPVTSSNKKYPISLHISSKLIGYITGDRSLSTANCLMDLREEKHDRQKIWNDPNKTKLRGLVNYIAAPDRRLILFAKNIGYWMTLWGTMVTGASS